MKWVRYWGKDTHIDQLNRINPEIDLHIYGQLIFNNKKQKTKWLNYESMSFSKTGIRRTGYPCGKN